MFGIGTEATLGKKGPELYHHKEFKGLYCNNGQIFALGTNKNGIGKTVVNSTV